MANSELESCLDDWNDLEKEFEQLEAEHKKYQKKLDEMVACQKKCLSSIAHHRYRMKTINETLKKNEKKLTEEEKTVLSDLRRKIDDRKSTFREMEEVLPHKNGLYLSIILGQVNISLLNKADKWIDAILHFLLVWYYCTLTIRESILVVNGSRIKGWWLTHHFISTVCAGISLIWPSSWSYLLFRKQYIMFMLYISMLYVMQYYYQSGSLYRLKALGQRHDMDITVEGFMSWMWKGMTFLLPFLFIGYFFQMYNAYILFVLSLDSRCHEWQVFALAFIYLVLCLGNLTTTLIVIRQKINKDGLSLKFLLNKYRFNSQLKQL
ncbi:transmembrane protein 120B-like isoform X2 [Gigantopelta aegis]|uniref:transmembrane protein 120B-like isoform X2 n=1 Tax=Gigantopelta aegis TaxID=1735272 RepID=UPI001B88BB34|nr:transmembrane protein 120B-like isoform X2 [Gigantopelta aegis]